MLPDIVEISMNLPLQTIIVSEREAKVTCKCKQHFQLVCMNWTSSHTLEKTFLGKCEIRFEQTLKSSTGMKRHV